MNPVVSSVEPKEDFILKLVFDNGEVRLFDVSPYLDKGIFSELKDKRYFQMVSISFGSIKWPNQQDFSKDTLYLLSKPL